MFKLIESINEGTVLEIKGNRYSVHSKVKYVTETETSNWYAKVQLDNHYVLVIAPYDDYMYFGFVGDPYPCDFPTPECIEYEGKKYTKEAEDYQMVKEFVFGDYLAMEGEVKYADYSCESSLISLGIIVRTQKRADVYADVIELDDVHIVE